MATSVPSSARTSPRTKLMERPRGGNQIARARGDVMQRQGDGGHAMGSRVVRARRRSQRAVQQRSDRSAVDLATAVGLVRLEAHAHLGHVVADALTAQRHGAGHGHGQAKEHVGGFAGEGALGNVGGDGRRLLHEGDCQWFMVHPHGRAQARAAAQAAYAGRAAPAQPRAGEAAQRRRGCQSTLAPVDLTTAAQRVISRAMCACSASGVEPTGS